MPPPSKKLYACLEFLRDNLKDVRIPASDPESIKKMGRCEEEVDNLIEYLGFHEKQHSDQLQKPTMIAPLRICPGGNLNTR